MNYYFITGTSRGIGKSLAELLLDDDSNIVYGFSRTNTIKHTNYKHIYLDLNQLDKVSEFEFPELLSLKKVVLINNAGVIGDIKPVGYIDNQKIINAYNINLIAPSILMNNFISTYSKLDTEKMVLNISSGAGRNPIDGWNVYCGSKAGLDMFSQVLEKEVAIANSKVKVLSLAPGVVDTQMQKEIRASKNFNFSNLDRFKNYKTSGKLIDPFVTSKQILRFINEENLSKNVLCSVRELKD
jgi:benzil reductase ((S)-benzoin forming)